MDKAKLKKIRENPRHLRNPTDAVRVQKFFVLTLLEGHKFSARSNFWR